MPKPLKKVVKKIASKEVSQRRIEVGEKVVVVTEYIVKKIIDQPGGVVLVVCNDKYDDRAVTFRKEELRLV